MEVVLSKVWLSVVMVVALYDEDAECDWSQFASRSFDMLRMSSRGCL